MTNGVKNLSVMRTPGSDAALKLIMETGMSQSEATRWALSLSANILKHGWDTGMEDRGTVPQIQVKYKRKA